MVAATESFAAKGEDCAEESAEAEIEEAGLLGGVGSGRERTRCTGGDCGHDLVYVPLGHDARLLEVSILLQIYVEIKRVGRETYVFLKNAVDGLQRKDQYLEWLWLEESITKVIDYSSKSCQKVLGDVGPIASSRDDQFLQ